MSMMALYVDDGLVGVLHGTLLDPRVHIFLSGELEHLTNLV